MFEEVLRKTLDYNTAIYHRVRRLPDAPDMPDFMSMRPKGYRLQDIDLQLVKTDPYKVIKNYKLLFDHVLGTYDWLVNVRDFIKTNDKNWFTKTMKSDMTSFFMGGESYVPGKSKTLCEIESVLDKLQYNDSIFKVLDIYYDVRARFLKINNVDSSRHPFTIQFFKTTIGDLHNHAFPIKIVETLQDKRHEESRKQMKSLSDGWTSINSGTDTVNPIPPGLLPADLFNDDNSPDSSGFHFRL